MSIKMASNGPDCAPNSCDFHCHLSLA